MLKYGMSNREIEAIMKIQRHAFKIFYNKFGPTWKTKINRNTKLVYRLDYYCYRHNINDPWYDYVDDPKYSYDSDDLSIV